MDFHIAGYHVPMEDVVNKLLPNLQIDRDRLEDFRLHYAIDRWLSKRKFSNVGSIVVPSNMDDFIHLPRNQDPEVSGVLFFFLRGTSFDELNGKEPTGPYSSTHQDPPTYFPDLALYLKQLLVEEGQVESKEIQWKTIVDQWNIYRRDPIGPFLTSLNSPIDETMIFKGRYYPPLLGVDPMTYYRQKMPKMHQE